MSNKSSVAISAQDQDTTAGILLSTMADIKVTMSHEGHPVMKHVLENLGSLKNGEIPESLTIHGNAILNSTQRTAAQVKGKVRQMINGKVDGITMEDHSGMYKKLEDFLSRTARPASSSAKAPSCKASTAPIADMPGPVVEEAGSDEEPTAKRQKMALQPRFNNPGLKILRALESQQQAFMEQQQKNQQAFRDETKEQIENATKMSERELHSAAVPNESMQEKLLDDEIFLAYAAQNAPKSMVDKLVDNEAFQKLMAEQLKDDEDVKVTLQEDADFQQLMIKNLKEDSDWAKQFAVDKSFCQTLMEDNEFLQILVAKLKDDDEFQEKLSENEKFLTAMAGELKHDRMFQKRLVKDDTFRTDIARELKDDKKFQKRLAKAQVKYDEEEDDEEEDDEEEDDEEEDDEEEDDKE